MGGHRVRLIEARKLKFGSYIARWTIKRACSRRPQPVDQATSPHAPSLSNLRLDRTRVHFAQVRLGRINLTHTRWQEQETQKVVLNVRMGK